MRFFKGMAKAGLASWAINQARKPQNQAKAKELFSKLTDKSKGATKTRPAS